MVVKEKGMTVSRLLVALSFVEAACALLFSPVVFALRGVIFGILAYRFGEQKLGLWGIGSNILGAAVGIWISLQYSSMMG
ncbi:hypothetical protein EXS73_00945 [Candidatus Pacearchaeota archaeon]|nr:hypothetical protein [Candidatus Pacearchaeota archaeon]